jgi:hypothetical protein
MTFRFVVSMIRSIGELATMDGRNDFKRLVDTVTSL